MRRWNNRTSFISRLSRRFPTYSFAELVQLMKQRSRATYIARYVRKVLKKYPDLAFEKYGSDFRDHWWTDPWWRTWKSQWELASNQSLRKYYGLPSDEDKLPPWTLDAKHRVSLPTADQLGEWQLEARDYEGACQPDGDEDEEHQAAEDQLNKSLQDKAMFDSLQQHAAAQEREEEKEDRRIEEIQWQKKQTPPLAQKAKDMCEAADVSLPEDEELGSQVQQLLEQEMDLDGDFYDKLAE